LRHSHSRWQRTIAYLRQHRSHTVPRSLRRHNQDVPPNLRAKFVRGAVNLGGASRSNGEDYRQEPIPSRLSLRGQSLFRRIRPRHFEIGRRVYQPRDRRRQRRKKSCGANQLNRLRSPGSRSEVCRKGDRSSGVASRRGLIRHKQLREESSAGSRKHRDRSL
jgi:hypothetical protein